MHVIRRIGRRIAVLAAVAAVAVTAAPAGAADPGTGPVFGGGAHVLLNGGDGPTGPTGRAADGTAGAGTAALEVLGAPSITANAAEGASAYNASATATDGGLRHQDRSWTYSRPLRAGAWTYNDGDYDVAKIHVGSGFCARRQILDPAGWWTAPSGVMVGPMDSRIARLTLGGRTVTSWVVWRCP